MRRTIATVVVIAAGTSVAHAGAPKTSTVTDVQVRPGGQVVVTVANDEAASTLVLAQLRADRRTTVHGCRREPTGAAVMREVTRLGLGISAVLAPDPRLRGDRVYVYQGDPAGRYAGGTHSLAERLVASGLAAVNRERGTYRSQLLRVERRARRAHRGRWRRCR